MSRTFKINKKYYDKELLYKKSEFTIEPGVTVLVGCNGSGKTTMLRHIKRKLEKEDIPYLYYDNMTEGGHNAMDRAVFYGDATLFATQAFSSEGEQIVINLGTAARKMGAFAKQNKGKEEMWFLLDAIDSGLSIDNVQNIKDYLFDTIISDNPKTNVYIVVSANEYEMCDGEQCFDVTNCEYIEFSGYDEYRTFIRQSRKYKDKRTK